MQYFNTFIVDHSKTTLITLNWVMALFNISVVHATFHGIILVPVWHEWSPILPSSNSHPSEADSALWGKILSTSQMAHWEQLGEARMPSMLSGIRNAGPLPAVD